MGLAIAMAAIEHDTAASKRARTFSSMSSGSLGCFDQFY